MTETATLKFDAAFFVRRKTRALMDFHGVEWTEYWGLLKSTFVVRGTSNKISNLQLRLKEEMA